MTRWILLTGLWMYTSVAYSQQSEVYVIPKPVSLQAQEGAFEIRPDTRICVQARTRALGDQLAQWLRPATGFPLALQEGGAAADGLVLSIDPGLARLGQEGYRLVVSPAQARIESATEAGVFYGMQTLRQLLPAEVFGRTRAQSVAWRIPCVQIEDQPRFGWRGMHLDVARHFMPKEFVLKYIDLLALHKMNRFHWHLSDDQGWRIQIRKYPKLTEVGAWRAETLVGRPSRNAKYDGQPHGGFYTQDEIREVVAYAKARHVTVVPEIDMPGHMQAAIAAYPELGTGDKPVQVLTYWGSGEQVLNVEESTVAFVQAVLTEVLELFDSSYIHVGGDEVDKGHWKNSPRAQARLKELGLKDEEELQSWFIRRMDTFLAAHGRRLLGWDEILEGGLAPGATVMSWRGEDGGIAAARAGHDVVMAPNSYMYLDYYQADPNREPLAIGGFVPLSKVYSYNPTPAVLTAEQARHILGVQGQIWTEYIHTPGHAEYMAYPRACALAEVAWTPAQAKDYQDFLARLRVHLKRLDGIGVKYRPLDP